MLRQTGYRQKPIFTDKCLPLILCHGIVIKDAMYNARIAAVNYYYKKIKGQNMSKSKGANEIYLTEEQYLESVVDWLAKDMEAWRWLAKRWASPEWIVES
jgi:hypothetical protein